MMIIPTVLGLATAMVVLRPYIDRRLHPRPWFTYSCAPLTEEAYTTLASRPGWAKTSLEVTNRISLGGLIRRPSRNAAPWLVFFPGNDAQQLANGQKFLEAVQGEHDWGLLVYAMRGFDSSGGQPSAPAFAADGAAIIENLINSERVEPRRINVAAFSLGGFVAANAVARSARSNNVLASLSLLSSVSDAELIGSAILARVMIGDIYRTLPVLVDVPAPVLVLHGNKDNTVDISQGRAISTTLGARAQFHEVAGAGHTLLENEEALGAVRSMVERSDAP